MSENIPIATRELLEGWQRRCRENQRLYYEAASRTAVQTRILGIVAIVLAGLLGAGLLATAQNGLTVRWKLCAGVAGIISAILTSIFVSSNNSAVSERYRTLGARFENVRRQIEGLLAAPSWREDFTSGMVERIRDQLSLLTDLAPLVPWSHLDERRGKRRSDNADPS